MAARVKKNNSTTVLYLYGVTQAPAQSVPELHGVDGSSAMEIVECAGMVCWISRVSANEYAEELAKNIENLDWLADRSTQHQRVVSAIAETYDILPARFGTVFLSEASLCADVESRKKILKTDFQRVTGSEEWGIKVFVLPPKLERSVSGRSGKEYLQAKSALLQSRKPAGPDEEIGRFAQELEKLSVATAEGGKISGGRRNLQYQISLLLKRSDRKRLEGLLQRYSNHWKEQRKIEATGPWAPYSFVSRSREGSS